jgi:hypothetical protein
MPDHAGSHGKRLARESRRTGRAADPTGREERAVDDLLDQVPPQFRADVDAWVAALRGAGRRPSRPVAWVTVRTYLQFALPVLTDWAARVATLREITRVDIEQALADHRGRSEHNVHTALRSSFRGLKREKRIFTDPARGLVRHYARRLPRALPSDRLRGLLRAVGVHPTRQMCRRRGGPPGCTERNDYFAELGFLRWLALKRAFF